MFIQRKKARFRSFTMADVPQLMNKFDCVDLRRFTVPVAWPLSQAWVEERYVKIPSGATSDRIKLAICDPENKKVLGALDLFNIDYTHRRADVGVFLFSKEDRGKGIGTESIAVALDIGFNWLGINRIAATVFADNEPSIRLVERFRFEREATLKEYFFCNGKFIDAYLYARMRRAFMEESATPKAGEQHGR